MKILLHDNRLHLNFAPLSLTRPVGDLRIGIFSNTERWKYLQNEAQIYFATEDYLSGKFPSCENPDVVVNAQIIPNQKLAQEVLSLGEHESLWAGDTWIARRGLAEKVRETKVNGFVVLNNRWDLYLKNGEAIANDFEIISSNRSSQLLSATNQIIGDPNLIFMEEGAKVECAIINTTNGPVYIGRNAEIMEGSIIRGPFAMCNDSALKMGAKIYGPTTLGPHCKVGGEVNNVIFYAYSNKGHDGFLGNALIGEWCNLGADTNTSNLKNNYGSVSTYSYVTKLEEKTDVQFMGLCMGDHSKCGINTMFNTASVVGVSCNIFGSGFPGKFLPSFTWGGVESSVPFKFEKAIEYANNMMARRSMHLTSDEIAILNFLFDNK